MECKKRQKHLEKPIKIQKLKEEQVEKQKNAGKTVKNFQK